MAVTEEQVMTALKPIEDPELHLGLVDLGLIYGVDITPQPEGDEVKLTMTFTSPFCPYGPAMVEELKDLLAEKGIREVDIQITFEPPWQPSDELREMMGM